MLPIIKRLKERKETPQQGLSVQIGPKADQNDPIEAIERCMIHMLGALAAKDPRAMAEAFYQAFCEAEAAPHEEAEHTEPHSFQAQNIKAGDNY